MPATQGRRWTAAEVRALPEEPGRQYEVIDGELFVSPGPSYAHQAVAFELQRALHAYVRAARLGYVLDGPCDVEADPHTLVQPDIFVVPPVDGRRPRDWEEARRLLLVAEVLSPSSGRKDRVVKRRLYQRLGTEYWIVDPDARVVERWRPGEERPELAEETITWQPEGPHAPLTIDLVALFAEALDG